LHSEAFEYWRARVLALEGSGIDAASAVLGWRVPGGETAAHMTRVGELAAMLAYLLEWPATWAEQLRFAAPLHDVGKLVTPAAILAKPARLDQRERSVMQRHAEAGARLLSGTRWSLLDLAADIAWTHHERWDGRGYPRGLAGEAIPLGGRIVAVVDCIDALASRRCYKSPWPAAAIREYLVAERGRRFDPMLVDLLIDHWSCVELVRRDLPDARYG
jgi:response regulator RpfG family c-di-GMP phosphodiesterase